MFLACHAEADKRRQVLKQKKTRILREHFELSVTPQEDVVFLWDHPPAPDSYGGTSRELPIPFDKLRVRLFFLV